jgi:hypothetical protein
MSIDRNPRDQVSWRDYADAQVGILRALIEGYAQRLDVLSAQVERHVSVTAEIDREARLLQTKMAELHGTYATRDSLHNLRNDLSGVNLMMAGLVKRDRLDEIMVPLGHRLDAIEHRLDVAEQDNASRANLVSYQRWLIALSLSALAGLGGLVLALVNLVRH